MDWIVDNAIALSAGFLGVVVLIALVVLALAGLRLWFRARAARDRIERERVGLETSLARLEASQAALPVRQAELEGRIQSLQVDVEKLKTLVRYAREAEDALRSPLRYIGR